ncbi:MAG TPA: GyrI-like domain-containing protein [Roseiarcus sp.]|jgi:effector-binding domain-containing protein|nr:GyrI-like domain-containing protein [Roseiarcus sp.]
MSSGLIRFFVASFLALATVVPHAGFAQQQAPVTAPSTPAPTSPSPTPAVPPAVQTPAAPSPVPAKPAEAPSATNPAPAAPEGANPAGPATSGEGSTGENVDLPARPFAYTEGKADKDEIYSAILNSLSSVKRDMDKANLASSGRPLAVFVESDDTGFKFHAGYPLAAAPDGKSSLSDTVKIGQTPNGKAMRFEHQGAYSDIDATYDAITAYLDDKGIDAQDTFIEEYANDVKDPDDPTLQVNIYVLLK